MATKYVDLDIGDVDYEAYGGDYWAAQFFTAPQDFLATLIRLKLVRENLLPTPGIITASLRDIVGVIPVGADLMGSQGTTDGDTLPIPTDAPPWDWRDLALCPPYPVLIAGSQYGICFRSQFGSEVSNNAGWRWTGLGVLGAAGSIDGGVTWGAILGDHLFEVWGVPIPAPLRINKAYALSREEL